MDDVTWTLLANHTVGLRAVGGWLSIESDTLIFHPNAFEKLTGQGPWKTPISAVTSLGTEPASYTPAQLFSGGLRARLAISLEDGSRELFVVANVQTAIDELQQRMPAADADV